MHKEDSSGGCPLCGSGEGMQYLVARDPDGMFAGPFHLVRCQGNCGVVYVPDAPPPEQMDLSYTSSYYGGGRGEALFRVLDRFVKLERVRLVLGLRDSGRLLDVGCGDGTFLGLMATNGWECVGIEASPAGAKLARIKHPELEIHEGQLSDVSLEPNSFDVITLWQVLEHVPEPAGLLRSIANLLKREGRVIVAVPNVDSWQARLCGAKWFHLDVPRHRWHFTPASFSELLRTSGLRVKRVRYFSAEYNLYGWWQSILNRIGCETNFAYKVVKRGVSNRKGSGLRRLYTHFCTVGLFPILFPVAAILALAEAALGRGGTMTVVAARGASAGAGDDGKRE